MISSSLSEEARTIHFNSLVIDGLEAAPMNKEHFNRLEKGGVDVVNYTCAKVTDDFASAAFDHAANRHSYNHQVYRLHLVP